MFNVVVFKYPAEQSKYGFAVNSEGVLRILEDLALVSMYGEKLYVEDIEGLVDLLRRDFLNPIIEYLSI